MEEEVEACCPPERPVYLLGESFGGILAIMLAARRPDLVDRLVLVNPATAFNRSVWPTIGTVLPQVPKVEISIVPQQQNCPPASAKSGREICTVPDTGTVLP